MDYKKYWLRCTRFEKEDNYHNPIHIPSIMPFNSIPIHCISMLKGSDNPGVCPAKNANSSHEMMEAQECEEMS